METITMEQYQQTGAMSEEAYMNTADEEIKRVVTKYEGKEKVERIRLLVNDYIDLHINGF